MPRNNRYTHGDYSFETTCAPAVAKAAFAAMLDEEDKEYYDVNGKPSRC